MQQSISVLYLVAKWAEALSDTRPTHIAKIVPNALRPSEWELIVGVLDSHGKRHLYSMPVRVGEYKVNDDGSIVWGVQRLSRDSSVWAVTPSYHLQGVLHAYVTIVDVPADVPFLPRVDA
jgi:hypothetical protein